MPRTPCPTGRLQHDPDRLYGGLTSLRFRSVKHPLTQRSLVSDVSANAARQPFRWPVEVAYRHVEGVSVSHPSHISHSRTCRGLRLSRGLATVRDEGGLIAVVFDQRP